MGLRSNQRNITITVDETTHDRLASIAADRGVSISRMLAAWLDCGVDAPVARRDKLQKVRREKDELFVSLPRDWLRRTGLDAGATVAVAYSDDTLLVTPSDR